MIDEHMNILGFKAIDKVTRFKGVITCVCFDTYGGVNYCITSNIDKDLSKQRGIWIHQSKVVVDIDSDRIVDIPSFGTLSFELGKFPFDNDLKD